MDKKVLITFVILFVVGISGCTVDTNANNTWGEKNISLNAITVLSNTTEDHFEYNNITYYYMDGYVQNNNKYDAFNVKMNATAYDQYGNIVAINNTVYIAPKNIPARGESYFYVEFLDPDKKIMKCEVNVINAKAEL